MEKRITILYFIEMFTESERDSEIEKEREREREREKIIDFIT